ncbi:MAG: 30S ribosomal protein S17 [Verrucomicrobiota bacterium]
MSESTVEQSAPESSNVESTGSARERVGIVVSDKTEKTIVVEVTRRVPHPLYKKIIKKSQRYHAHDTDGKAVVGDRVSIEECRPVSKLKRWRLKEILKH